MTPERDVERYLSAFRNAIVLAQEAMEKPLLEQAEYTLRQFTDRIATLQAERDAAVAEIASRKRVQAKSSAAVTAVAVPSEEMKLAGARALRDSFGWPNQVERAAHCYEAMLRAAALKGDAKPATEEK